MKRKKRKVLNPERLRIRRGKTVAQASFQDKHPSSGCVFTLSWNDLKVMLESFLEMDRKKRYLGSDEPDKVESFKVTDRGIDVYHTGMMSVREGFDFFKRLKIYK